MDTLIGRTLSHYRIIGRIGAGGMGVVYRAHDERLDRDVAVKVLPSGALADEASRRRFRKEALTLSKLNHPHVATVYDFDTDDGVDFLVMEYVSGVSLDERLAGGALSEKEVARLGSQLAQGLAAAHAEGIIHRDLKPGNLRVTTDSRLKILDFGLAKALHTDRLEPTATTTETGVIAGTLPYMSPEQLRGEKPDERSDIYSAGVVLYEAATGRRAFPQSQAAQVIDAILRAAPPPPRQLSPQISTALDGIIVKAMDRDPDFRYHAARELAVDLERLAMPALRIGPRREFGSTQRWFWIAGVMAAGILALLWSAEKLDLIKERFPGAPTQRQLTYLGNVGDCDLSPDGRTIAYVIPDSTGPVRGRVVVQDVGGGAPLTVLNVKGGVTLLWSPDGAELLVQCLDPEESSTYIVPRLGGQARRYPGMGLAWSPDGARFATMMPANKGVRLVDKASGEFSFVPIRGTFTWIHDVDWCPKGDRLLIETADSLGKSTLWTISTRGEGQQRVLEDSGTIEAATWSARGDEIRYLRPSEGGSHNLLKIRIDPKRGTAIGKPTVLLGGLHDVDAFSLSRDGRRFAYTRSLTYSNLWRMTLEGSGREARFRAQPITSGTALYRSPNVSLQGDRVVFVRGRSEESDLWTISVRGGDPCQITHGIPSVTSPVWAPDGSKIAFVGEQGGAMRVWVVGADGLMPHCYPHTLVSSDEGLGLAWSATRGILYDAPGNQRIDALDPDAGQTRTLIPSAAYRWVFYPLVSPDGSRVAFLTNGTTTVVRAEDPSELLLKVRKFLVPLAWSRDGAKIFALNAQTRIMAISAESGAVVPLPAPQLPGVIGGISASPDGRTFVAIAYQSVSDVVMVERFDPEAR